MEESEKRRERLKAMRDEAAQSGVSSNEQGSGHGLSNPLIEAETTSTSVAAPRFDFYTDPMAAYSANKRKNTNNPSQFSPRHYNASPRASYVEGTPPYPPPPPAYHHPSFNLPGQMMYQAPSVHYNNGPLQSPMETGNPRGMSQGNSRPWGGSSGAFNYNNPPNFSRGGSNFRGPGNVQGCSPYADYGRGRGNRDNSSSNYGPRPYSNYGRGGGCSPGLGARGGRGAEGRPELYYKKEMVEDPWRFLNPLPWKSLPGQDSEKRWHPPSMPVKKAKASLGEASRVPQPSLAEILASSLHDPSPEAVDTEQGT